MNRVQRWWYAHREIGRMVDGQWVEAPQRIEKAWAWLMGRPKPFPPPRRIVSLFVWTVLLTTFALSWVLPVQTFRSYLEVLAWTLIGIATLRVIVQLTPRRKRKSVRRG